MIIRNFDPDDARQLEAIHDKYFKLEFDCPNFLDHFLDVFSCTDNSNKIIATAGIRPIVELVMLTDKSRSIKERREAVYKLIMALSHAGKRINLDQIHAFAQGDKWQRHLKKFGFNSCKGEALYLDL